MLLKICLSLKLKLHFTSIEKQFVKVCKYVALFKMNTARLHLTFKSFFVHKKSIKPEQNFFCKSAIQWSAFW